jgi:hypothetical protein
MASFRGFKALVAKKVWRLREKILRRKSEKLAEKSEVEKRGIVIVSTHQAARVNGWQH